MAADFRRSETDLIAIRHQGIGGDGSGRCRCRTRDRSRQRARRRKINGKGQGMVCGRSFNSLDIRNRDRWKGRSKFKRTNIGHASSGSITASLVDTDGGTDRRIFRATIAGNKGMGFGSPSIVSEGG